MGSNGALKLTSDVTLQIYNNGTGTYTFHTDKPSKDYVVLATVANRGNTKSQTVNVTFKQYPNAVMIPVLINQ